MGYVLIPHPSTAHCCRSSDNSNRRSEAMIERHVRRVDYHGC